jgi:DnaJ-domain-containing protein 1
MTRPLTRHGIDQLEEMFVKEQSDARVLKQLAQELPHMKKTPRAVALLTEVQNAIARGTSTVSPTPAVPRTNPSEPPIPQADLFSPPAPPASKPKPPKAVESAEPLPTPPPPLMPVEDAYKLLRATPTSTWESIEQTRRQLVQQASPSRTVGLIAEKRAQFQAAARRINAAYETLFQHRLKNG